MTKHRADAARSSQSSAQGALRRAESEEKKVVAAERKIAEIRGKIAQNTKRQAEKVRGLVAAEKTERVARERAEDGRARDVRTQQQSADRQAEQRRRVELHHAQNLARIAQPIIRYVTLPAPQPECLRVLYLTADADPAKRLRVDAEMRSVRRALKMSKYRDLVDLQFFPAATPEDVIEGINDMRPHVVHFSGHGIAEGLLFDNGSVEDPSGRDLGFELLARALAATDTPPRLLVLNACRTAEGAEIFLPAVPVVIAMAENIEDEAASVFSPIFYGAIASAQSVAVAMEQAKVAMSMKGLADADLPTILAREDVSLEDLVLVQVKGS